MGVSKLWELLLTIAEPLPIEQLEGQVLAVDASIWLVKIDSLFASAPERLKAFLSKVMLMRRHNILPLFVFDGPAPALKRRTLQQRARRRLVADELEAKKRSQLEIARLLDGEHSRASEQSKRSKKREEQLGEVNKTLRSLAEIKEIEGNEQLEKIAMQSQILNAKHRLLLELAPQLKRRSETLTREEFSELDLESKLEVLQAMEEMRWKQVRRELKGEDEESRLRRDLVAIEKRSTVRQMQDQLFRKMMQKHTKIENGYEIVEIIYNGRHITQKRKVRTQQSSMGFALRKGKMKNDPTSFSHKEEEEVEPQDQFIAAFCSNKPLVQKYEVQQKEPEEESEEEEFRKVRRQRKLRKDSNKEEQSNQNDDNNEENGEKESSEMAPSYFGLRLPEERPQDYVIRSELASYQPTSSPEKDADNPDNLPTFIGQLPGYQNFSNDNLQMQNLLTILGIPFLIAPAQAEAQCAALQLAGIVDGIITEDSDAFLFGGQKIYRGVFQNNIRLYRAEKAKEKLGLDRVKLIIFALLLGCDYSQGVKGIGLVNAMQILKAFPNFERLDHFRAWAERPDALQNEQATTTSRLESATREERQFYELHRKFKNYWHIDETFSSQAVRKAFLQPHVLESSQLQRLRESGKFGETACRQEILKKLLSDKLQLNEKEMDHFMRVLTFKFTRKKQELRPLGQFLARITSKRLQKSIGELS